jgi:hypothetical protein
MQQLLARDQTPEQQAIQASLKSVLVRRGDDRLESTTFRDAASRMPDAFFSAAFALLASETDPTLRRRLYTRLLDCPEFLIQLTRPDRFSREELLEVCRDFMRIDSQLDIRLARLAPSRQQDTPQLDPERAVRVLDVLDEISTGPRLVLILSHLTRHPHPRIAAKATMLMGRRLRNDDWVRRHLSSPDPRVRASVLEASWGIPTPAARDGMRTCLNDEHNRVVGNALVGLHLLGEPGIDERVTQMLDDQRPAFRATAAWAMGRIAKSEFIPFLQKAQDDPDGSVRKAVGRALDAFLKPPLPQPESAKPDEPIPPQGCAESPLPEWKSRLDGRPISAR